MMSSYKARYGLICKFCGIRTQSNSYRHKVWCKKKTDCHIPVFIFWKITKFIFFHLQDLRPVKSINLSYFWSWQSFFFAHTLSVQNSQALTVVHAIVLAWKMPSLQKTLPIHIVTSIVQNIFRLTRTIKNLQLDQFSVNIVTSLWTLVIIQF